jgi:MFS transporter, FSR family, fosmidomycin resistance protein
MPLWLLLADLVDEWLGWLPAGLLGDVRGEFHLDYARASGILVAHFVGGYVGGVLGGVLADVSDRRRLLLGGVALYTAGLGLASSAENALVLVLGCLCIGLASGPVVHTAQLILVDRAREERERLERSLGRFNALGSIGDILGPGSLALLMGAGVGWRALFAAGAVLMAVYGLGSGAVLQRSPQPGPARESASALWPRVREVLTDRRLLRLALALALLDGLDEPFAAFVLLFLRDVAGVSAPLASFAVTWLVGSTLAGFALASHCAWPRARAMEACLLGMSLGLVGFLLVPGLPLRVACLAVVGVSTAAFYTTALAEAFSLRPDSTGTVTSVLSLIGPVSLVIAPLVGALADAYGLARSMAVYVALPVLMLLLVRNRGRS